MEKLLINFSFVKMKSKVVTSDYIYVQISTLSHTIHQKTIKIIVFCIDWRFNVVYNIVSKQLAAFPHRLLAHSLKTNEAQWLLLKVGKNAGIQTHKTFIDSTCHYRLSYPGSAGLKLLLQPEKLVIISSFSYCHNIFIILNCNEEQILTISLIQHSRWLKKDIYKCFKKSSYYNIIKNKY